MIAVGKSHRKTIHIKYFLLMLPMGSVHRTAQHSMLVPEKPVRGKLCNKIMERNIQCDDSPTVNRAETELRTSCFNPFVRIRIAYYDTDFLLIPYGSHSFSLFALV